MQLQSLQEFINELSAEMYCRDHWGTPASYIPELSTVAPAQFGITVVLDDGKIASTGESEKKFSIQSVSKIFLLSIALGRIGDALWTRVGREPSGMSFDSIVQLEHENGRPRNPFLNAGAIVTTDALLEGRSPREALAEILQFVRAAAEDEDIHINKRIANSEQNTGHRNFALANYLLSWGNLRHDPALVLGTYFHQCAIEMSTRQLARAGRYLARLSCAPHLIGSDKTRRINALMMTCGQCDGSGEFAYKVGLPSKSGVSGAMLMIAPGKASVAIWSPGLDGYGNSLAGTEAAQRLSTRFEWSVF